jgi:hypothetical protein
MPTVYGAVDLVKNELRNAVMQNLGTAPAAPVKGLMYFNSADNTFYWYDGTQWIAAKAAAGAVPSDTVTTAAIGDAPVPGASTLFSRGDHKHGMPAFGAITVEQTFGSASTNGAATTLARSDHAHGNPTHDNAAHAAVALSALGVPTASVNLNSQKIINLADPTLTTDAANKQYVDGLVAGLSWKNAVSCATTGNITLSGTQTIDGYAVTAADRVLVKNQTNQTENGIYIPAAGAWTRSTDMDVSTEFPSAAVFVKLGTVNKDTAWTCTNDTAPALGTTNIVWAQFSGAGTYTAGNGLTLTANTFDVGAGTGITVAADTVAVDTTVIATQAYVTTAITGMTKKFAAALTGTASPETVTHNLNTRDVHVQVLNGATPYTAVEVDWDATTVNTVTIRYNPNLGAGYRVVVVG